MAIDHDAKDSNIMQGRNWDKHGVAGSLVTDKADRDDQLDLRVRCEGRRGFANVLKKAGVSTNSEAIVVLWISPGD